MNPRDVMEDIRQTVIEGDEERLVSLIGSALDAGVDPGSIMQRGLMEAMNQVGELYDRKEYFVPEVLLSAMAMKEGLSVLRPLLTRAAFKPAGKVVIGTVHGDMHEIGKNIVALTLEGAGFEVLNLGVGVPVEDFVSAARKTGADIIGMSALLTTTRTVMAGLVEALEEEGIRDRVRVLIGGAAVSERFAREIGADGFGRDAMQAVDIARNLV